MSFSTTNPQEAIVSMVAKADGAPLTTEVSVRVRINGGNVTNGNGTLVHLGNVDYIDNGMWAYLPSAAEMSNSEHIAIIFSHSSGIGQVVNMYPDTVVVSDVTDTGGPGPWTSADTSNLALEASVQLIIETGGDGPWTTGSGGTAITPQEIRDSMLLPPSEGTPGLDSVDHKLDMNAAGITEIIQTGGAGPWTIVSLMGVAQELTVQEILDIGGDGPWTSGQFPSTVNANVVAVDGNTGTAQKLVVNNDTIVPATVTDPIPSSTGFDTDLTEPIADHWKNRAIIFTSGSLKGSASVITGYLDNGHITVAGLPGIPANGDTFVIV